MDDLTLTTPLVLPEDGAVALHVSVGAPGPTGERPVTVYSRPEDAPADQQWTRHATGVMSAGTAASPATAAVGTTDGPWPPAGAEPVELTGLYERLDEAGLAYEGPFQGLTAAWRQDEAVLAEVSLPEGTDIGGFGLHPALLDAALHATALLGLPNEPGQVLLPFSWTGVCLQATGASALRVRISRTSDGGISLTAADGTGQPVISFDSLTLRAVAADQLRSLGARADDALYRLDWVPTPPVASVATEGWALVADDRDGVRASLPFTHYTDLATVAAAGAVDAVVIPVAPAGDGSPSAVHVTVARALSTVQSWLTEERFGAARLVFVTRRAVAVAAHEDVEDPAAAAVWGLVRSAQSEHPGRFVLVDVDGDAASWAALPAAVATGEPQLALRQGELRAARLARPGDGSALTLPTGARDWRLEVAERGTLDGLRLLPAEQATEPLGAGQVRVAVRATGLNFRDVLLTLGVVDQEGLGSEGAGVVVEVGPGVTHLAPGDRAFGLFAGSMGSVVVADARMLVGVPEGWSFARAASVPVVFL
ncbi:polyketide synthase dehydratase domain-containing protein, partial [Streptomyces sp. NPDC021100]|uniref:SpnB-like Rossmann fold domain-containing protein n=1 Tax=Streptomyces sp. NPDC021100 TaxID=3365114 RepID=UPI0037BAF84F